VCQKMLLFACIVIHLKQVWINNEDAMLLLVKDSRIEKVNIDLIFMLGIMIVHTIKLASSVRL